MSLPHESEPHQSHPLHPSHHVHHSDHQHLWIDTWWPLLVILFGALFISALVFFNPMH